MLGINDDSFTACMNGQKLSLFSLQTERGIYKKDSQDYDQQLFDVFCIGFCKEYLIVRSPLNPYFSSLFIRFSFRLKQRETPNFFFQFFVKVHCMFYRIILNFTNIFCLCFSESGKFFHCCWTSCD